MTPVFIIVGLMLLGLWLTVLSSWRLRNWRATALALAGTAAIGGAGFLPWPLSALLQAGLWTAVLWVLVIRSELVGVMPPEEYRFVEEYLAILQRVARRRRRARRADPATSLPEFEAAIRSLESLPAPGDWSHLRFETARELDPRLLLMRRGTMPTAEALRAADDQWLEVERVASRMVKAKAGFWRGWPYFKPRSDA